jgi:hypothetical protein
VGNHVTLGNSSYMPAGSHLCTGLLHLDLHVLYTIYTLYTVDHSIFEQSY